MSYIVKGHFKPHACEEWKNREFLRCTFLDEHDDCALQAETLHGRPWAEQYKTCPLVRVKRQHGRITDLDRFRKALFDADPKYADDLTLNRIMDAQEVILPRENDMWNKMDF